MTEQPVKKRKGGLWLGVGAVVATAAVTFGITALLMNISDKKEEGQQTFVQRVEITETTVDPAVWGENFPIQYQDYLKTKTFTASNHSTALVPRTPTEADPRTETPASKLEEDPRLTVMWAGMPFSKDYRHARGHEYMAIDQEYTLRVTQAKPPGQPGACLNCHASTVSIMDELGNGDMNAGFAAMNKMPYADAAKLAEHPVSCIDCHDPKTMALRITRPALINGLKELKKSEGIADYDVNKDATRDEMRSYVCAQCHVEYHFKGDEKTLTFPWKNGLDIDNEFAYYQEIGFTDFTNAKSEAKVTKAQHPEFEVWSQSVHAANGVTCADCHMSYKRDGAMKVTNHDIASPINNLNGSCGTCHQQSETQMKERIDTIQNNFIASRDRAMDALTGLIGDIEKAMKDPATPAANLELARQYQNKASFYVDYMYSENSYGFHAPEYQQRVLNESLDASRMGQLALRGATAEELKASDISVRNASASGDH